MKIKNQISSQNQISLLAFKADKLTFNVVDLVDEDKNSEINKFNLKFDSDKLSDLAFGIVFNVTLEYIVVDDGVKIVIELDYVTLFECSESIDDDFMESTFVKISAPAIGFPYVRAFISNLSLQAGFPPIILPSINFVQFSQENEEMKNKMME